MGDEASPIRRIVIVGGGTAGWMSAAGLARVVPSSVTVTLIESEEIGTVGVGEATIPTLSVFNEFLGIDEDELIRATGGSFKLGIEFVDWWRKGERYIHPFGTFGLDTVEFKFHHLWLRLRQALKGTETGAELTGDITDYSLCALSAKLGRFGKANGGKPDPLMDSMRHAFHFDAARYAQMLRAYAEARGVHRIEGRIVDTHLRAEDGHIEEVTLTDGRSIAGDLFVDCSGFRSLLIGGALKTPFVDWSAYLPCDRALAVPSPTLSPLPPFTRATADTAGWRWRIPLQHRTGNGYVYSSRYIDDDAARKRLLDSLDGTAMAEPRQIAFQTGHRERFWVGNCVAIGLAGGFIEPLESTSIHLIQMGIARLIQFFPDSRFDRTDIAEYERQTRLEYEQVRDFIVLHYKATERDDTPFWRYCRDMAIPETLAQKIDLFRSKGRIVRYQEDLFTEESWLAVLLGQGILPRSYDQLVDRYTLDQLVMQMRRLRGGLMQTVQRLPTHGAFLDHLNRQSAKADLRG